MSMTIYLNQANDITCQAKHFGIKIFILEGNRSWNQLHGKKIMNLIITHSFEYVCISQIQTTKKPW